MRAKSRKLLLVNATWAVLSLPLKFMLYVASVGPACWLTARPIGPGWLSPEERPSSIMRVYCPLGSLALTESHPGKWLRWWMRLGVKDGDSAVIPTKFSNNGLLILE